MRNSIKIALAGVSLLSLASPTYAAEATGSDDEASSGTIIVEARRKDEDIQEVPLTVNAVSAATLEKLNIRDFKEISSIVPGLNLTPGNGVTGAVTSMRGLAVDVNASGNNGTVEFYLNDAPVSNGVVMQSMFDIGQIEVLRGPQGTLRGRASPSGAITVTTRRPDMENLGGYVQGTANDLGAMNLQGALNFPIIKGLLSLRVAALADDNEGDRVKSFNSNQGPSSKTRAVRVSLRATPIDGLEINANYSHLVKNFRIFDQVESLNLALGIPVVPTANHPLINAEDRLGVENVPRINRQEINSFNWQVKYSFAGQRLDYVGSLTKQDLTALEQYDKADIFDKTFPGDSSLGTAVAAITMGPNGYPVVGGTGAAVMTGTNTSNLQNLVYYQHSYPKQQTHELRLSSEDRLFGMVDYVVGGMISKLQSPTALNIPLPVFGGAISTPPSYSALTAPYITMAQSLNPRFGRTLEKSFFGNLTLHVGEATEISGGLRHISYQEDLNGTSPDPSNAGYKDRKYKSWIWSGSIKHKFSDDIMGYATAGSSFRLGSGSSPLILMGTGTGINLTNITDPVLAAAAQNNPEKSKSYEIGIKTTWLDKKVTVNVAAFHQDFDNYIFSTDKVWIINNNAASNQNTSLTPGSVFLSRSGLAVPVQAKVDGIEAELAFRPNSQFSISANVAYAKSKMKGTVPGPVPTPYAGGSSPNIADVQGSTTVNTNQVYHTTVSQSASRTPPFTANIQAEYSHPVLDGASGFVRGLLNVYGNSKNNPQNPYDDVKSYALANLYVGVRADNGAWEVTAYAKNLFNTFRVLSREATAPAVTYLIGRNPGVASSDAYRLITSTDPREFGITARFAFGSR